MYLVYVRRKSLAGLTSPTFFFWGNCAALRAHTSFGNQRSCLSKGLLDGCDARTTMTMTVAQAFLLGEFSFVRHRHDALDETDFRLSLFGPDGAIIPLPVQ